MAIVSKSGDTYVVDAGVNPPRYWTGNASMDFKFGALLLDGSDVPAVAWPVANVDYADSANSGGVAPYGEYKWEFFLFGSATPVNVAAYPSPTGSGAGALTDLSLSWTVPALLGRVDGAYLFGQNNAVVKAPATTSARCCRCRSPWLAGVATSSATSGITAAQNPRCSEADKSLVPLVGVAGDYRELGLNTTLTNGVRLISIDYWQQ